MGASQESVSTNHGSARARRRINLRWGGKLGETSGKGHYTQKKSSDGVGAILFMFQETVLCVLSFFGKKSVYQKVGESLGK